MAPTDNGGQRKTFSAVEPLLLHPVHTRTRAHTQAARTEIVCRSRELRAVCAHEVHGRLQQVRHVPERNNPHGTFCHSERYRESYRANAALTGV